MRNVVLLMRRDLGFENSSSRARCGRRHLVRIVPCHKLMKISAQEESTMHILDVLALHGSPRAPKHDAASRIVSNLRRPFDEYRNPRPRFVATASPLLDAMCGTCRPSQLCSLAFTLGSDSAGKASGKGRPFPAWHGKVLVMTGGRIKRIENLR